MPYSSTLLEYVDESASGGDILRCDRLQEFLTKDLSAYRAINTNLNCLATYGQYADDHPITDSNGLADLSLNADHSCGTTVDARLVGTRC